MILPDYLVVVLILCISIAVTICIAMNGELYRKDIEIERLQEMMKKNEAGAFYSVHFKGKDIEITENSMNHSVYKVKWKTKQYNGTYNSMMIDYNGLDPETWYVLQLRTAYDVWRDEHRG